MSNPIPLRERRLPSGGGPVSFELDPVPDEIRAADDREIAIFAVNQIEQRGAVQLLQVGEIQQRPQTAIDSGMNELVKIRKMRLK
jgi:hypothetical protein